MHTNSYDDADGRRRITQYLEDQGCVVYDPPYNTGKVGDLFYEESGVLRIAEVEQMGMKAYGYSVTMKRIALGKQEATGQWAPGFSIPARKFLYTADDHLVSNRLKQELGITNPNPLMWEVFFRITPTQSGVFIANRKDVSGIVSGTVNCQVHSFHEDRPAVPWGKVSWKPL